MRRLIVLSLFLTLNACYLYKKDGIEVGIKNNSSEAILAIEFTTTEQLDAVKFDRIKPNQTVTKFLSMNKNKTDGAYSLTLTRMNGNREVVTNGYYTNGSSMDHWVDFIVEDDTIIAKFDAPIY